ncbi:MAG TPA: ATP-binding cassette domain-containing protein [Candidatus Aquicultor sp.]
MAYLEINGLSYTFEDGTKALDSITVSVKKGEFVGLLASNGGGKTTLLKALVGLYPAKPGAIKIDDVSLSSMSRRDISRMVGLVFQNPNDQLFAATVAEDVAFGPRNLKLDESSVAERVQRALELVGIAHLAKKPVHRLSFGQQKKASIAGILAMEPELLLLDEPTAGLDPKSEASLLQMLERLNKENGVTIIVATHMVDLMPLFVDRIFVLKEGRLTLEGTPEEVFSSTQVMEEVDLRLPYIAHLVEELKHKDNVQVDELPLTIKDARKKLISIISEGASRV